MSLRIGDIAPDFTANTTQGTIKFHQWLGDSWGILFSHPKDFTPVCTTELGAMAKLSPDFKKRNVKVAGLSVDPVDKHASWAKDIAETQGFAPDFPMIEDPSLKISKLYDMLPAGAGGEHIVELRDLEAGILDHREIGGEALRLGDVLRPARVLVDWIDAEARDLDVALLEVGAELGPRAQLR